jgi:immunoglobulin-binding protein 1
MTNEIGMIQSLLPPERAGRGDSNLDNDDDDDFLRELILLVLRLTWAQAMTQLEIMNQELDILRSAPRMDEWGGGDPDDRSKEADLSWRLDNVPRGGPDGRGPLLDSKGKVSNVVSPCPMRSVG